MKPRTYTVDQLIIAIKISTSIRQVLSNLNLKEAGGNYASIKRAIKYYECDISHFTGQSWNKGKIIGSKRTLEEYFTNKFPITSHKLRLRLIKEGYFEHKCSVCDFTHWQNVLIPLELDHIDGNHDNNELINLRLLCANCHALTKNYRGKNQKRCKQII